MDISFNRTDIIEKSKTVIIDEKQLIFLFWLTENSLLNDNIEFSYPYKPKDLEKHLTNSDEYGIINLS